MAAAEEKNDLQKFPSIQFPLGLFIVIWPSLSPKERQKVLLKGREDEFGAQRNVINQVNKNKEKTTAAAATNAKALSSLYLLSNTSADKSSARRAQLLPFFLRHKAI